MHHQFRDARDRFVVTDVVVNGQPSILMTDPLLKISLVIPEAARAMRFWLFRSEWEARANAPRRRWWHQFTFSGCGYV